uniref:Uncharacterized protein n=1 Tax=Human betaherpesvirus 6 TaxID=10368 RepID=A0A5P9U481_9BETA|nr:hypothetical protein [Human betaherpesvirus 6]
MIAIEEKAFSGVTLKKSESVSTLSTLPGSTCIGGLSSSYSSSESRDFRSR